MTKLTPSDGQMKGNQLDFEIAVNFELTEFEIARYDL